MKNILLILATCMSIGTSFAADNLTLIQSDTCRGEDGVYFASSNHTIYFEKEALSNDNCTDKKSKKKAMQLSYSRQNSSEMMHYYLATIKMYDQGAGSNMGKGPWKNEKLMYKVGNYEAYTASVLDGKLVFQSDGNLAYYLNSGELMWLSNTAGRGFYLAVQADNNVVIYDKDFNPLWATGLD